MFQDDHSEVNSSLPSNAESFVDSLHSKLGNHSPPHKVPRTDNLHLVKPELVYPSTQISRDEFSVFGEYIANELRSLKGEKNLLVLKKKIQDAIFEVKMGMINEPKTEDTACTVYVTSQPQNPAPIHSKLYSTPVMTTTAHIDPLTSQTPTSGISEIIINGACHYSNFKVDTQ